MAKIPEYFYFRVHAGKTSIELEDASDIDVVEVVRCKDCKFGRYDIFSRGMYCGREYVQLDTNEDDFCSFAERKTDGSDK
mgnify:CR=1 FL=1